MRLDSYADRLLEPLSRSAHLIAPAGVMLVLLVMVVPVPAALLDLLISTNLAISLVILVTATYILRPTELSVFPSLLLLTTLYRLSLNVASTRRILLSTEGTESAGRVIEAFGQFVVGGNYVVGVVVFLVLISIQYIVINHGAVRISEVTARFTLDAMPGKQMAIDADLNAGIITEKEAQDRRADITREAEFYGAMDGAIRFTQRDAVASIIITLINIIAGFVIGVVDHGLSLGDAARTYTVLTIGDGLVSAIPSLLVSVAGAIVTTRSSARGTLGQDVSGQLLLNPRPLVFGGGALLSLAVVPGLANIAFFGVSAVFGLGAYLAYRKTQQPAARPTEALPPADRAGERLEDLIRVDPLGLEIGFGLIPLMDESQGGELLPRLRSLRKQIASELGFIVPQIHIVDNLKLDAREYVFLLRGADVARGKLQPGSYLALDAGGAREPLGGTPTKEPAFGLPAWWISSQERERAQALGYTVVDPATVLATHAGEIIRRHGWELVGRQETRALLDVVAETHPKLVEDLVPKLLSLGEVHRVLQNLLRERVSVRDLPAVLDALGNRVTTSRDPVELTEAARQALGRAITGPLLTERGDLPVVSLGPKLERELLTSLYRTDQGPSMPLSPSQSQSLLAELGKTIEAVMPSRVSALLCGAGLRFHLSRLLERGLPSLPVLAREEVPPGVQIVNLGQVAQ
jgi:flagellar biosynthesis protein FlhA